jgi:hypothetical protein
MAKKQKQKGLIKLEDTDILKPIDISKIGSNGDPCFGKEYNLSTKECKMCGDSELCCIKFAALVGKDRKQLEKENEFKDLENLVDLKAVSKTIRYLKRKDESKKTILDKIQAKYELSREEARTIYKSVINKQNGKKQ